MAASTGMGQTQQAEAERYRAGDRHPVLAAVRRGLLYPGAYGLFVALATLDLLFTWAILHQGGRELNVLADWVIQRFDLPGVVAYKFGLVLLVVLVCEAAGRKKPPMGVKLAYWAVALTAFPVLVGALHLLSAFAAARG